MLKLSNLADLLHSALDYAFSATTVGPAARAVVELRLLQVGVVPMLIHFVSHIHHSSQALAKNTTPASIQSGNAFARVLDALLAQSLQSLGIIEPPRPLTADEVHRLPLTMLDILRTWWASTQRDELTKLGLALGLFDPRTVPANLRHKFVVFDSGEPQYRYFDTEYAAFDASESIMRRDIGPINAAYYAATDSSLPVPHVGVVAEEDVPLVTAKRMSTFDEARGGFSQTMCATCCQS